MRFFVFESGSKGNCTLISSKGHSILIDCGLSKRKLTKKLGEVNLSIDDVELCLFTHSHLDHTSGIANIPEHKRYCCTHDIDIPFPHYLDPYQTYQLGGFKITPFSLSHDAECVGYLIDDSEERLSYITDTGYLADKNFSIINNCEYYIMESNHDVRMELESGRPQRLIDRVIGYHGHLSNEDASYFLSLVIGDKTREIIFAHLSLEANNKKLPIEEFNKMMKSQGLVCDNIIVKVASQVDTLSCGHLDSIIKL